MLNGFDYWCWVFIFIMKLSPLIDECAIQKKKQKKKQKTKNKKQKTKICRVDEPWNVAFSPIQLLGIFEETK